MEENINIADILKDKPYGISLYSSVFGSCVYRDNCDNCIEVVTNNCYYFNEKGHYITNGVKSENGECLLFPSNEMRDWSKFAWKKGDVLVSRDKNMHLIFEKFTDDTYTIFAGKHCYEKDFRNEYNYERRFDSFMTEYFTLETDDADVQTYIRTIENKLGGKLNLETLEVEKHQSEFVDLKPKWTPKPFDRVITRTPDTPWTANFFSHIDSDGVKNCIDDRYLMCLPYNEETAKLIGTTNNWEG